MGECEFCSSGIFSNGIDICMGLDIEPSSFFVLNFYFYREEIILYYDK